MLSIAGWRYSVTRSLKASDWSPSLMMKLVWRCWFSTTGTELAVGVWTVTLSAAVFRIGMNSPGFRVLTTSP